MAKSLGSTQLTISSERRTWRVNLELAQGQDPVITAYREVVRTLDDESVLSRDLGVPSVSRSLTEVDKDVHTLRDGTVISAAQVMEALEALVDEWEDKDEIDRVARAEASVSALVP